MNKAFGHFTPLLHYHILFGDIDAELIEGGPDGPILWVVAEYQDNVGFDTKLSLWALNLNQQTGVSMPFVWPGAGPQDIFYSPRLTSDNAVDQNFPVYLLLHHLILQLQRK